MKQHPTAQLRAIVKRGNFLELPAAFDPLTARLIESIGFQTVHNGGFVTGVGLIFPRTHAERATVEKIHSEKTRISQP